MRTELDEMDVGFASKTLHFNPSILRIPVILSVSLIQIEILDKRISTLDSKS